MQAIQQLAPKGVLRAAMNLANTLLVERHDLEGKLSGVAPDLVSWIAEKLSVPYICVPYASPSDLVAAVDKDEWDICLIATDPGRAHTIAFTRPYAEIEATYLVREHSSLGSVEEVDRPSVRIAAVEGSAYALWLARHLAAAELVLLKSHEQAQQAYATGSVDVLAGLRTSLSGTVSALRGSRMLEGRFMGIAQAVGTHRRNEASLAFLDAVVSDACSSGFVERAIATHRILGLNVTSASND